MPYRHGPVPFTYDPAFITREYQRIAEAYDEQDALGGLQLPLADGPIAQQLTVVPTLINAWTRITPTAGIGDGPVQTDPQLPPASSITVGQDGIYLISYFANFSHELGGYVATELFINDIDSGLGAIIDASQQSDASSLSVTGMFPMNESSVVDMRASTLLGTEDISWVSSAFQVFKLRDLRTRFS